MEELFLRLKKQIKFTMISTVIIFILIIALSATMSIIFKNYWIIIIVAFLSMLIIPLLFRLGMRGFSDRKINLIKDTISSINSDTQFVYQKNQSIEDLEKLKLDTMSQFYYISGCIDLTSENGSIRSYTVRFTDPKRKRVIGRMIVSTLNEGITYKESDISSFFLKKADYTSKVKVIGNNVYLFMASYIKNKESNLYSLEPHDFNKYELYVERIKKEFELYDKLLGK